MSIKTSLEIENFGPITKGSLTINPLTIFVGKNNTGKSYTAMLYYSLIRSLLAILRSPLLRCFHHRRRVSIISTSKMILLLTKRVRDEIERCFLVDFQN